MQASELIGKKAHRTERANCFNSRTGQYYTDGSYMNGETKILRVTPTHIITKGMWGGNEWELERKFWGVCPAQYFFGTRN